MRATLSVLCIVSMAVALGCSNAPSPEIEANKQLVKRFGELSNAADWEGLSDVVAEDFVRHSDATPGPPITSREAFIDLQKSFLASMPDQRVTMQQMVAEGDYVAVLATYSGTQTGAMGEFPPTGEYAELQFLALFRIKDGLITELWVEWDNLAMLQQLGLFRPPPPPEEGPDA